MLTLQEVPTSSINWEAWGTIAQGAAAILSILTLYFFLKTFYKSMQTAHYTELDTMYFDLLKIAMETPHVIDPHSKRNDQQKLEYDIYAFMVWNFVESIVDRCSGNKNLCKTWDPIIVHESNLHREWFSNPQNFPKFKEEFRKRINSCYFGENLIRKE